MLMVCITYTYIHTVSYQYSLLYVLACYASLMLSLSIIHCLSVTIWLMPVTQSCIYQCITLVLVLLFMSYVSIYSSILNWFRLYLLHTYIWLSSNRLDRSLMCNLYILYLSIIKIMMDIDMSIKACIAHSFRLRLHIRPRTIERYRV